MRLLGGWEPMDFFVCIGHFVITCQDTRERERIWGGGFGGLGGGFFFG